VIRVSTVDELFAAAAHVGFPAVVKPEFGASAVGCIRVDDLELLPGVYALVRGIVSPDIYATFRAGNDLFLEEYLAGEGGYSAEDRFKLLHYVRDLTAEGQDVRAAAGHGHGVHLADPEFILDLGADDRRVNRRGGRGARRLLRLFGDGLSCPPLGLFASPYDPDARTGRSDGAGGDDATAQHSIFWVAHNFSPPAHPSCA